jgi:DNA-binding GntR family transcriptional regulator
LNYVPPRPVAEEQPSLAPPSSLHVEVLGRLRDFIVEGNLGAGAKVPERELCRTLGISRTPLREALKVLAAEGLVDLHPNRGARVRSVSADDLRHMFEVMAGLEALAGRLACERITDGEIAAVEQLHYAMYACYVRRELHDYFDYNQQIHERIMLAAGNPTLREMYGSLGVRMRRARYRANLGKRRDRWGEAMREHEAMLDALRRRAGQELSEILYAHLRNKGAAAIELADTDADADLDEPIRAVA